MNKKILSLLLVMVIALSFVLCACDDEPTPPVQPCTTHVDANSDGKCDTCGADVEIPFVCTTHVDFDGNGKCDYCDEQMERTAKVSQYSVFEKIDTAKCITFDLSFSLTETAQGITSQGPQGKVQVKIQQTEDDGEEQALLVVTVFGEPAYNFYFDGENIALEEVDGEQKEVVFGTSISEIVETVVTSIPQEVLPTVLEAIIAVSEYLPTDTEEIDLSESATELFAQLNQIMPAIIKFEKGVLSVNRKIDFAEDVNAVKNFVLQNKDTDLFEALLGFISEQAGAELTKENVGMVTALLIDTTNDEQTVAQIVDLLDEVVGAFVASEEEGEIIAEPIEGTVENPQSENPQGEEPEGDEKSFFESFLDDLQEQYGFTTSEIVLMISQALSQYGLELNIPAPVAGQSLYQYIHGLLESLPVSAFWELAGDEIDSNAKFAEAISTAITNAVITPAGITEKLLGKETSDNLWSALLYSVDELSIATEAKFDTASNLSGLDITFTFSIGTPVTQLLSATFTESATLATYAAKFSMEVSLEEFDLIGMPLWVQPEYAVIEN